MAFAARSILLSSGFYYILPISSTKTVLDNTSGFKYVNRHFSTILSHILGILQDWPPAYTTWTILLPSGFYYILPISSTKTVLDNTSGFKYVNRHFSTILSHILGILQDWPPAYTTWTILLPSGFYYFLPISSTKTVLNNTSGY